MQEQMKKKPALPSKQAVYDRIRDVKMSPKARDIAQIMVDSAMFEYCIIAKQLTAALGLSRSEVEIALNELMQLRIIKQQALYGTERNYILNPDYFTSEHPVRRTKEELRKMLTVITN